MLPAAICRAFAFLFGLAAVVCAQYAGPFFQLVATDSGDQVYFISRLALKTDQSDVMKPLEGRLYELGPGGVRLILERGEVAARTSPYGSTGVMNPQVSGDGVLLAATLSDVCNRESGSCTPLEMWSVLRGAVSEEMGAGTLQLSRNGRWALLTPAVEFGPQQATLIDIHNGLRTAVPLGPIEPLSRKLASDGTVLVEKRSEFGAGTHEFALGRKAS